MGLHSKTATIEFKANNGDKETRDVVYIDGVMPFFKKIFKERGYKKPAVTIELDSGQGQFLVVASGFDRDMMGDESGNDCDFKATLVCTIDGCEKSFAGKGRKMQYKSHMERVHLSVKTVPKMWFEIWEKGIWQDT